MAGVLENREFAFKIQRTDALAASSLESVRNNETLDQQIALQLAPEEVREDAKPGIKHSRKLELEERVETLALNFALKELPVHATSNSCASSDSSKHHEPGITCKICLETKSSSTFLFVKDCQHMFCRECMSTYVEVQVTSTKVPVICPHERCRHFLGNNDYEQLTLPPPILESLTEMEVAKSIPQLERFYCPFPDCSALQLVAEPGSGEGARLMNRLFRKLRVSLLFRDSRSRRVAAASQSVNCHSCQRLFCAQCQVPWHPWHAGYTCKQFQKMPTADVEGRTCDDAFKELVRNKKWRECPNCHSVVERVSGCIVMTCRSVHKQHKCQLLSFFLQSFYKYRSSGKFRWIRRLGEDCACRCVH